MLLRRLQGYSVLHIHWLYTLGVPDFVPFSKTLAYVQTTALLWSARLFGYKLVWTAHNVLPHNPITSNDLAIRRQLARLASAVIVHTDSTKQRLIETNIIAKRWETVPHGNYNGVYANTLSKSAARKRLCIPMAARVITFFGIIDTYKNVPALIEAYVLLARTDSRVCLLIAGRCNDPIVKVSIAKYQKEFGNRLQLHDTFIADDDVQLYMNAADICAFPFSEITTSGSVLLAATFGKPIVAPSIGALGELPPALGVLYDPLKKDALESALSRLLHSKQLHAASLASSKYSDSLSWSTIATTTMHVYESLN